MYKRDHQNAHQRVPHLPPAPREDVDDHGDDDDAQADGDAHNGSAAPLLFSSTTSRGQYHQRGSGRRVKLYVLEDQTWVDRGTGYCAGVYDEAKDEALLVVRKEECCESLGKVEDASAIVSRSSSQADLGSMTPQEYILVVSESLNTDDYILDAPVIKDDVYQRQHDTLVVWTDLEGYDMALSFQELEGCNEVWDFITEVQHHFALSRGFDFEKELQEPLPPFELPLPTLENLDLIEEKLRVNSLHSGAMREKMVEWLLREEYVRRLVPLFEQAEARHDLKSLHTFFEIMRTIFMINDNIMTEYLLQENLFMAVAGMLEYNPEQPHLKASYRSYLQDETKFHQIVEFEDPTVVTKINETYRLIYLKDVMLASFMDDGMLSMLNSLVFFFENEIVTYCISNEHVWDQMRKVFQGSTTNNDARVQRAKAILFIQQLCALSRQLQLPSRVGLIRSLVEGDVLTMMTYAFSQSDSVLRNAATEILMTMIEHDAACVRERFGSWSAENKEGSSLFHVLIRVFLETEDAGLRGQITEAWRVMMDVSADGVVGPIQGELDAFLGWLYGGPIQELFEPFQRVPPLSALALDELLPLSAHDVNVYLHLCDLLCFAITQHAYRSRHYVLTSNVCRYVGSLLHARDKHMRLAALRVIRSYVSSGDHDMYQSLIDSNALAHVLALLQREAPRDNLVSSACLGMFEQIRKENVRPILEHVWQNHHDLIHQLRRNVTTGSCMTAFSMCCERHGLLKSNEVACLAPTSPSSSTSATSSVKEKKTRLHAEEEQRDSCRGHEELDKDEESYFADEPENETAPPVGASSADASEDAKDRTFPSLARRRKAAEASGDDDDDEDDLMKRVAKRQSLSHEQPESALNSKAQPSSLSFHVKVATNDKRDI